MTVSEPLAAGLRLSLAPLDYALLLIYFAFVIDQQPFLEGYMAVQLSAFEARYGQHPFGPVFTGPSLVTNANAAQVQQLYKSTGIPLFNGGYPT